MNEHEANTCQLNVGDRVILTNEAVEQIRRKSQLKDLDLTDVVWKVTNVIGAILQLIEDRKTIMPRELSVGREDVICEHETVTMGLNTVKQMAHVSETAHYKEYEAPSSFIYQASTERGKGIVSESMKIGGNNVRRIEEWKSYRRPWASQAEEQQLDLLLMLAHENNALADRVNMLESIVKRLAHAETMRRADEVPEDQHTEDSN